MNKVYRYELYHADTSLGEISEVETDFPGMIGRLSPTAVYFESYKFFFDQVTSDGYDYSEDLPRNECMFNESLWWLVEPDGKRIGISMPAIHADYVVHWRWRTPIS